MSRSTAAYSATTTNGQAATRSLSLKANNKPQSPNPLPTSDIRLFVANLRLLDLHLRPDWPAVTVQTFSARNADQKQRIAATEWALFRLFQLWDADETAQKLQPFFPPLEPLQSLNLRAALYRCLNELKKNGLLGKESVLRKTMLDECKGDKFYDILALFSNVVVKKMLIPHIRRQGHTAITLELATAPTLSAEKQRSLLPLAIAHQAALTHVLKRKEEKRTRFLEFERLLQAKAEDINFRIRECKNATSSKKSTASQREYDSVKRQLKENWVGNQNWLDVMLHGDNDHKEDAFFNNHFDSVWRSMEAGQDVRNVASEVGLLQNLQCRVNEQQERLQKWRVFGEELQGNASRSKEKAVETVKPVKKFTFNDHLQYQLPSSKQKINEASISRPSLRAEYQQILTDLDSELLKISQNGPSQPFGAFSRRRRSSASAPRSPARTRKMSRSESIPQVPSSPVRVMKMHPQTGKQTLEQVPVLPKPRYVAPSVTPLDSEATLIGQPSTFRRPSTDAETLRRADREVTPPSSDPIAETPLSLPDNRAGARAAPQSPSLSPSPSPSSVYPSEPPVLDPEPPNLNAEEALAEQIISSIGNATPSPVKKPQPRMSLSLVERTRMSMARATSFEAVPESPELPLPPPPPPAPLIEEETDRRATLLERTRLSMVAMQNRPRMSMTAREKKEKRKSRQSLFPVNQFDTPRNRKSFERLEALRATQDTPKEELLSDEADYDRIFKSRPKIATSPVFTPHQGGGPFEGDSAGEDYHYDEDDDDDDDDAEITGIDLADVDQDDEDGFTRTLADSPTTRRAGPRARY